MRRVRPAVFESLSCRVGLLGWNCLRRQHHVRDWSDAWRSLRLLGIVLVLWLASFPGPGYAGLGIFFPVQAEAIQAEEEQKPAASSPQALMGTGRGATEAEARTQSLEAISLQIQATLHSTYGQQSMDTSSNGHQGYTQRSVKLLSLRTGLEQQAGLSVVTRQRRGEWVAEARLDRASAMQAIYQREYLERAIAFRAVATQALTTSLHPVQFTPMWRQALAQYSVLPGSAQTIELLAAPEARRSASPENPHRREAEDALRGIQARATGEAFATRVEDTLPAQRTILLALESDRALYTSLLDAGQKVWGRAVLQVRGSETPITGENREEELAVEAMAIQALAAGLSKRNMGVDQGEGERTAERAPDTKRTSERVTARLQKGVRVQRPPPGSEPGPVSCEVTLGLQLELSDGSVVPMGKAERAVGRHRSETKDACLSATRLLVEDVQWLDQYATLMCTVLPCEAGS